jgi:phage gp46-like protein
MAKDVKIIYDPNTIESDIKFKDEDLVREEGLETSVLISLFTDRRADDDDTIDDTDDKRGWWADSTGVTSDQIGSKLWQLDRASTTQKNMINAKQFCEDALQWMIDDGVAAKITVNVERFGLPGNDRLAIEIKIFKKDGNVEEYNYDNLWNAQFNG